MIAASRRGHAKQPESQETFYNPIYASDKLYGHRNVNMVDDNSPSAWYGYDQGQRGCHLK